VNKKALEKWFVDLKNFTCRNTENQIVIGFEKQGSALRGKIKEIPLALTNTWVQKSDIDKVIRKALIEADEAFFKAYFAKEIETKCDNAGLSA
jgi:hypothetical protein